MISSEEGFEILRNWQTQKTVLWFVSLEFSDMAHASDVRVKTVSDNPPGIVLCFEGSEELEPLDLLGAEFDETGKGDSPFPDIPPESFVRFLYIFLTEERRFLLVERTG